MPRTFTLETHDACNNACTFCFAQKGTFKLTMDEISATIDRGGLPPGSFIMLMGGEPLFDRRVPEVVDLIHRKGYFVLATTNGFALADPAYCDWATHNIEGIRLSVHSDVPEELVAITRRPGAGELQTRCLDNVERAKKAGAPGKISFNVVVSHINFRSLPAFMERLSARGFCGASDVKFKMVEIDEMSMRTFKPQKMGFSELRESFAQAVRIVRAAGLRAHVDDVPLCLLGEDMRPENRATAHIVTGTTTLIMRNKTYARDDAHIQKGLAVGAPCWGCSLAPACPCNVGALEFQRDDGFARFWGGEARDPAALGRLCSAIAPDSDPAALRARFAKHVKKISLLETLRAAARGKIRSHA